MRRFAGYRGDALKTHEAIIGKCSEPRLIKLSLRESKEHVNAKTSPLTWSAFSVVRQWQRMCRRHAEQRHRTNHFVTIILK